MSKVFDLAEEAGDIGAHRVDQEAELSSTSIGMDSVELLGDGSKSAQAKLLGDSPAHQILFALVQVDATVLVDNIADLAEFGLAQIEVLFDGHRHDKSRSRCLVEFAEILGCF